MSVVTVVSLSRPGIRETRVLSAGVAARRSSKRDCVGVRRPNLRYRGRQWRSRCRRCRSGRAAEVDDRELAIHGSMRPSAERQHLHRHALQRRKLDQPLELLPHDIGPADRTAEHRLIQHDPEQAGVVLGEKLLTPQAEFDSTFELLGLGDQADRADDCFRICLGLEVAGDNEGRVCAERGGGGFEPGSEEQRKVAVGSQPALLSRLASELDQLVPLGIGNVVELQHVPPPRGVAPTSMSRCGRSSSWSIPTFVATSSMVRPAASRSLRSSFPEAAAPDCRTLPWHALAQPPCVGRKLSPHSAICKHVAECTYATDRPSTRHQPVPGRAVLQPALRFVTSARCA